MERLTIDEIIAHCKRQTDGHERRMSAEQYETADMLNFFVQEYWEHRQVAEYLEELKYYRKAEKQGLLLRLPCKVGTPVYMVEQDCGGDTLDCRRGGCEGCEYLYRYIEENEFQLYMCEQIGKNVFFTREAAEAALAEKGTADVKEK